MRAETVGCDVNNLAAALEKLRSSQTASNVTKSMNSIPSACPISQIAKTQLPASSLARHTFTMNPTPNATSSFTPQTFSLLNHRVHFSNQQATTFTKEIVKDFIGDEEDEHGVSTPVDRFGRQWEWVAGVSHQTGDWERWERHPDGDELVMCISGSMQLAVESPAGQTSVRDLPIGHGVVVPAGTWHRGIVAEPGDVLTVTFGSPSQHRRANALGVSR